MFVKKNHPYICSICVEDANGIRVSGDTPYVLVKNVSLNTYYNGLFFESSETRLQMRYSQNGVYIYEFTPDSSGTYEVSCISEKYSKSNTIA